MSHQRCVAALSLMSRGLRLSCVYETVAMDISVHDNYLLSYSVDAEKATICFYTAYLDGDANEHTDVIFDGVAAYHFECDNLQTILFDIYEAKVNDIYNEHEDLFDRFKNHGWPNLEYKTKEDLLKTMEEQAVKGFVIRSSLGLHGWIWAKSMTKRPK
jgi:hypothetical protein